MTYEEAQKEFVKIINSLSGKYNPISVFQDFCLMSTVALHNAFDKRDELEEQYLRTAGKYEHDEVKAISRLLALAVEGFEDRLGDFLGEAYEKLEISNSNLGQFFTPYCVAKLSAAVTITDKEVNQAKNGVFRINEPACGGGAMIVAALDVLKEKGVNYQKHAFVTAMDLDSRCVYMTYITLTLLGCPAVVVHGNTLTMEVFDTLYTPFYRAMPADMKKEDTELLDSVLKTVKPIEQGVQLSLF